MKDAIRKAIEKSGGTFTGSAEELAKLLEVPCSAKSIGWFLKRGMEGFTIIKKRTNKCIVYSIRPASVVFSVVSHPPSVVFSVVSHPPSVVSSVVFQPESVVFEQPSVVFHSRSVVFQHTYHYSCGVGFHEPSVVFHSPSVVSSVVFGVVFGANANFLGFPPHPLSALNQLTNCSFTHQSKNNQSCLLDRQFIDLNSNREEISNMDELEELIKKIRESKDSRHIIEILKYIIEREENREDCKLEDKGGYGGKKDEESRELEQPMLFACDEIEKPAPKKKREAVPKSAEEVLEYMVEYRKSHHQSVDGLEFEAEQFFDYHASRGWTVGKAPMKDWRAAVRTWLRNREVWGTKPKKLTNGKLPHELTMEESAQAMMERYLASRNKKFLH